MYKFSKFMFIGRTTVNKNHLVGVDENGFVVGQLSQLKPGRKNVGGRFGDIILYSFPNLT